MSTENGKIIIETGPTTRLSIARWDAPTSGRVLIALTPEYLARRGAWHLAHSAVCIPPQEAARVAAAIRQVAAHIDGNPIDPEPTERDRDESRMP